MALSWGLDAAQTRMLKQLSLRMASAAKLLARLNDATRRVLHRQVRVSTISATTRIENAVLTDAQIELYANV